MFRLIRRTNDKGMHVYGHENVSSLTTPGVPDPLVEAAYHETWGPDVLPGKVSVFRVVYKVEMKEKKRR